jgi:hypothetical protein
VNQAAPSLPLPAIAVRYWVYALPIWLLAAIVLSGLLSVAWFDPYSPAPQPFALAGPMLLSGAPLLLLSFFAQMAYVRWQLGQWRSGSPVNLLSFTLIFYVINLILSVIYSFVSVPMLLALVFFYFITLIIFFLLPIHLLIGYLLGRYLQRVA